jgi:hypothetical protein
MQRREKPNSLAWGRHIPLQGYRTLTLAPASASSCHLKSSDLMRTGQGQRAHYSNESKSLRLCGWWDTGLAMFTCSWHGCGDVERLEENRTRGDGQGSEEEDCRRNLGIPPHPEVRFGPVRGSRLFAASDDKAVAFRHQYRGLPTWTRERTHIMPSRLHI